MRASLAHQQQPDSTASLSIILTDTVHEQCRSTILNELAQISEREWDRRFRGSALCRVKSHMLRRNVLANQRGQQARRHAHPEQPDGV